MNRSIRHKVTGFQTQDGAGVKLVRVLGSNTAKQFDPILMLDSFDSYNPDDYTAGFPFHPHRGIETISYIYSGSMTHKDSLGNTDTISDGEVQWMTAGSGIMHEEQIPPAKRMLGVQLWLNLSAKDKMVDPQYHAIRNSEITEIEFDGGKIRLLAGKYKDKQGFISKYQPLDYYDVHLEPKAKITIDTPIERSVMLFTLSGAAYIADKVVTEKTTVRLTEGDSVEIRAANENAQVLFISSISLDEPIAWGGPIVMNTERELNDTFKELENGTFLNKTMNYDEK